MTKEYDKYFRLYGMIYFDGLVAWPWFRAQAMAESNLDTDAVSPAGARGLMQVMPGTAKDIAKKLQIIPDISDPKTNIHFGICYMWQMWLIFRKEAGLERLRFAMGAYNAGAGNIIKAQKEAQRQGFRPDSWLVVAKALESITGEANAKQTRGYVRKIERIRAEMIEA